MKKILYSFALVAVAGLSAHAQRNTTTNVQQESQQATTTNPEQAAPTVQGPLIEFEKVVHDYGQIQQGANGESEFKFKNAGTEPLVLTNVQASCGCTVPTWPREPVMPGQESSIKVRYDTNRLGHIGKAITVYSNSIGGQERVTLRVAGNVHPRQN